MPSTYTVNLGIEKPATGEQSGTWGDTTNVNFDILDQAINGAERVTLTSAGSSGSPNALNITNGATSDGRNKWIEFYSSGDLGGSAYVQLVPDDAEKIVFIRNSLASSRSVILFQGTYNSGRDLEIPAGVDMVVKFDGGGASAATVTDVFTKLRATEITTPTLTATTADIDGGTIDNSVIGGSTAAAVTGTTVVANTSLNIAGDGATVTGIKDEDDMSSNSPTKLATQQSIKAYVDSQVGTVDTWAEVLANGATSGSTNPEVTAGQALKTNTINETSAGSGVTIDSVLLKDDVVNATDIETGSISANDGTASATIANSTGVMTIASSVLTTTDINGGSIDGTNIGASSAATGAFTTLNATGAFTGTTATLVGANTLTLRNDTATDADEPKLTFDNDAFAGANHAHIQTGNGGLFLKIEGPSTSTFQNRQKITLNGGSSDEINFDLSTDNGSTYTNYFKLDGGYAIFNETGVNVDFRVESDGNANMLFVDAGNNAVGIGESSPASFGTLVVSASNPFIVAKSSSTSNAGYSMLVNGGSNGVGAISTDDGGSMTFDTGATGAAQVEKMRIQADGAVILKPSGITTGLRLQGRSSDNNFFIQWNSNDGGTNYGSIGSVSSVPGLTYNSDDHEFLNQATNSAFLQMNSSAAVFNEDSADRDFRVESNNNANMIRVDGGNDRVGIGESTPTKTLSVLGDAIIKNTTDGTYLTLHSTQANNASGPDILLFRDSASPADDDALSTIFWQGKNSVGSTKDYMKLRSYILDVTDGTEDFGMDIQIMTGGNAVNALDILPSELVINNASVDRDFRVESDGNSHMVFVDAGNDRVSIGSSLNSKTFNVVGGFENAGFYRDYSGSGVAANYVYIGRKDTNGALVDGVRISGGGDDAVAASHTGYFELAINKAGTFKALLSSYTASDLVVNDNSDNIDFRIESDALSHMFFVDASASQIGIGQSVPDVRLHVIDNSNGSTTPLVIGNEDYTASTNQKVKLGFGLARDSGTVKNDAGEILVEKANQWDADDANIDANMLFRTYTNNAASTKMTLQSSGKIVIGNDIPIWSGSYGGGLFLKGNNATADRYAQLTIVNSSGDAVATGVKVNNDGSVSTGGDIVPGADVIMANGRGISFTATGNGAGMTSELLDDYEEGTWTPAFGAETSNPTVGYNAQIGHYTKVGRQVNVNGYIITTSRSGGSGTLTVDGLPFTVASGIAYFSATIGFNYNWNTPPLNAGAQGGTTHVLLYQDARTNSVSGSADIVASGNTYFYFNCTYYV